MSERRSFFLSGIGALSLWGFVSIALAGCRDPSERTAMAQVSGADEVGSTSTATAAGAGGAPTVRLRRVWAGEYRDFYASSISPDGRYLSMIDWSTTDLAVRDLHTGTLHRLTNVERGEGKPYEDAGVSVFSRDGRKIVVGWQYFPDLQLRLVDFELDDDGVPRASDPTVLFHNPEYHPYYPFDWSPDGLHVLAKVYTSGNANQLALISTVDGTYRALKSFDWREPTMAEFSPDGRYVAYDFPPDLDSSNRDVFVLSVDGTRDGRVASGPAIDRLLGWHPDGSILFHSDRGGTPGIWRVPMSDGRAGGPPERVKADTWGVEPLGFAGDRFYYGVDVNPRRLYTATLDFESGQLTSAPTAVADPTRIEIHGWDWSPDGKLLAYSGRTPGSPGSPGSVIGIHTADGEELRTIRIDLRATSRIRWHPDGTSLIAFARDSKNRRGFYRIDLESGTHHTILHTDAMDESTPRGNFALSSDGGTLFYARGDDSLRSSGRLRLVAYDLETGDDRHLAHVSSEGWGSVALSPDGSRLAIFSPNPGTGENVLGTIPVAGGVLKELRVIPADALLFRVGWTPDGRSIVFTTARPQEDGEYRAWLVPVEGGDARRIELGDGHGAVVKLHPDGRRIAFRAGESRGEVWVMEASGTPPAADAAPERSP